MIKRKLMQTERSDYRAALICTVMANANRGPKQKPFKPDDFMPQAGTKKQRRGKRQKPEEMLAIVQMINAAHGGKVEEG